MNFKKINGKSIYKHALKIQEKYRDKPEYVIHYLSGFLKKAKLEHSENPCIVKVRDMIKTLKEHSNFSSCAEFVDNEADELLKKEISDYYLPRKLINLVMETGEIPKDPEETWVGIGFIDIADYSYLSRWLSPKENQVILNGLYSALKIVLDKRGGYLNKMEGDSMMFQYGGRIDPNVAGLSTDELKSYIACELFYTCIEMQEICSLFNNADKQFLDGASDSETRDYLFEAFNIISSLRENLVFASAINSLFQIRIRIGANMGEVSIGNFGPRGAKQWDIIGIPVIEAKRMEATAPIGGLRISETLYQQLDKDKITDKYLESFRARAAGAKGFFKDIEKEEMFKYCEVKLKDKKNITFRTYSIQVDPELPESLRGQVSALLQMGVDGASRIIEILQYYRGNRQVINALEALFLSKKIYIRKDFLLKCFSHKLYKRLKEKYPENFALKVNRQYSLFSVFRLLGKYQDHVKQQNVLEEDASFGNFKQYFIEEKRNIDHLFMENVRLSIRRLHFFNKIFPTMFHIIKTSILEYQHKLDQKSELLPEEE